MSQETLGMPAKTKSANKIEAFFAWAPFLYPLVLLAAITGTWLLAFLELGAMPRPNLDDPKSLHYLTQIYATEITIMLLVCAPGAALAGLMAQFLVFRKSLERRVMSAACLALTWVACFVLLRHDPFGILNWLFD